MWQGIQGHDAVVERFRRTLQANRLASTYLFVGPEGVGKRAFALKLAQTLLCTRHDPADMEPCGQCESCLLALAGNHPDLDLISLQPGKRQLLLSQFVGERDSRNQEGLCRSIALRPMIGRRRVAIIDDADWFNVESANCLLKTLEEPPPGAVIILIGTSRSRQLPTILSRAQIVRFQPLSTKAVSDLLQANGIAGDDRTAGELAQRSQGSVTSARELADQALWQMRDRIMASWHGGEFDLSRIMREIEEFINDAGKEAELRRNRFRQLLTLVARKLSDELRTEPDADDAEILLEALDLCLEAEQQLDRNANQSTLLESWADSLSSLSHSRIGVVKG
jgi:DNA polymerase-3 subunit delta'